MPPSEQAHALRVCKLLLHEGEREADLLAAALLHDIGKSLYPLRIWERVWIVLYHRVFEHRFLGAHFRMGKEGHGPPWWARPMMITSQHPEWGARMLEEKGASPITVWLVRNHQEPIEKALDGRAEEMLEMLRRADQVS
ncbi:MAG: HD domain-containing protein [Chloroflexota bacterium]